MQRHINTSDHTPIARLSTARQLPGRLLPTMAAAAGQIQAQVTYWDRNPPYAAIALAQEAGVALEHAADPKATKETIAKLQFANGCVAGGRLQSIVSLVLIGMLEHPWVPLRRLDRLLC